MTHIRSRSLAAAFAALLLAAIPTAGYGASPPDAAPASCGASTYVLDLTAPADPNAATVVTVELGSDCLPSLIGPVVVNTQLLGVTSPGHVVAASIGPSSSGAAEATAVNVSTRRAISQSIDAVGIIMTEASLLVRYWWNEQQITNVYVELAESHHPEPIFGGWYLDSYSLTRTAGCVGCSSIEYRGTVDWGYRGVFDPTGSLYHNRHVNTVTAFGTGQARCSFNIIWRNSLPGWRQRFICTS
jgi:hypothetical protein